MFLKKSIDFFYLLWYYNKRFVGQAVKTPPSQGGITGSIPVRTAIAHQRMCFFYTQKHYSNFILFYNSFFIFSFLFHYHFYSFLYFTIYFFHKCVILFIEEPFRFFSKNNVLLFFFTKIITLLKHLYLMEEFNYAKMVTRCGFLWNISTVF